MVSSKSRIPQWVEHAGVAKTFWPNNAFILASILIVEVWSLQDEPYPGRTTMTFHRIDVTHATKRGLMP